MRALVASYCSAISIGQVGARRMKKFLTLVLGSTALMGISMMGTAQAEPDYAYAATGFVGGGGAWLSADGERGGLSNLLH